MGLIDWREVGFGLLWISGLSVVVAALSFADYSAGQEPERLRRVVGRPGYQMALNGGLLLFCLGVAGSEQAWWWPVVWGALAVVFAYLGWAARRRRGEEG